MKGGYPFGVCSTSSFLFCIQRDSSFTLSYLACFDLMQDRDWLKAGSLISLEKTWFVLKHFPFYECILGTHHLKNSICICHWKRPLKFRVVRWWECPILTLNIRWHLNKCLILNSSSNVKKVKWLFHLCLT